MVKSQTPANQPLPFNEEYWLGYIQKLNLSDAEKKEFLESHRKSQHSHTTQSPNTGNNNKPILPGNSIQAPGCSNMDFEAGSTQGWSLSCGFHPIFNNAGCCLTPGGQQFITNSTANAPVLDPFGNFPVVAPGGNFSLRLGNSGTGGQADRIQQTFQVSAANANFTYKYAVVFQDPGHILAQQPSFVIEMFDSLNNAIPCTYYNVAAGQNIPGFMSAANGVVYKPWTSVVVDLTNYIGQNVTIRFTTYDCALGGHFGYAYIDGNCAAFQTTVADTICVGQSKTFCAPPGFGSYLWSGGSINGQTSQCVTVNTPGNYAVQTTMVTNCQGPTFSYPLHNHPTPNANFNIGNSNNTCNPTINFNNTSSMSSGNLTTYLWNFGDNTTSTLQNPTHTYANPGTYTVSLIVGSSKGCYDTTSKIITINPPPFVGFSTSPICVNAPTTFTSNSAASQGNINQWSWAFSNGGSSTMQNPTVLFPTSGVHTVTLTVITNQGCFGTGVQTVMVNPLPVVNFVADSVCLNLANTFINTSTISSGNISNYVWNFGNNNTSTQINPTFTFPNHGSYNVQLTAISNNNCIASVTKPVVVHPNPVVNITALNACANSIVQINNSSSIASGFIQSYIWDFGNSNQMNVPSPLYMYNNPGNYNISLTVTSNYNCAASGSTSLAIHPLPQVNFSANNACLNQSTQFNNSTIINSGNIVKWLWDFDNNGSWDDSTSVSPNHVYAAFGNYYCTMMAVSNNNCISKITNSVVVYPNPIANFTYNKTCLGDKTTFTNLTQAPGSFITSYQWQYYGDGNISNVFPNAAHTYSFAGVFLVKLEVQNEFGCTNVMSKPLYVNPKPVPMFVSSKPKACGYLCVDFTNQSTISTGSIATYQWIFGDASPASYQKNPNHCYNAGKYDVTLKVVSDSGCMATYIEQSAVEVYPKPIASFHAEPLELDELEPLVNVTNNASNADQTMYYINDGSIFSSENFSHLFTNLDKQIPIIFQVAKNNYGCADTTSVILKVKQAYAIYVPNTFTPNEDGINDGFKAKGFNIIKYNLKIFDRWGHLVFETNDMDVEWDGKTKNSEEPIKDDVYVWKADVVDINNKTHNLIGHVTLLK